MKFLRSFVNRPVWYLLRTLFPQIYTLERISWRVYPVGQHSQCIKQSRCLIYPASTWAVPNVTQGLHNACTGLWVRRRDYTTQCKGGASWSGLLQREGQVTAQPYHESKSLVSSRPLIMKTSTHRQHWPNRQQSVTSYRDINSICLFLI